MKYICAMQYGCIIPITFSYTSLFFFQDSKCNMQAYICYTQNKSYIGKAILVKNKTLQTKVITSWSWLFDLEIFPISILSTGENRIASHTLGDIILVFLLHNIFAFSIRTKELFANIKHCMRWITVKFLTFNITSFIIKKIFLSMECNSLS